MRVNQNIYPYNPHVNSLPVYLAGLGGTEWQPRVVRPEGYLWHQILYSAKGSGCLKYGKTTVTVSEGWFFVLPAGCPHEYYPLNDRWEVRWAAFDGFASGQLLQKLGMDKPFAVKPEDCSSLTALYNRMFTVLKTDGVYGSYTCAGLLYEYIMEFYRLTADRSQTGRTDRSSLLMPVLSLIDSSFMRDLPITELAAAAGVTPQHLCRIFKETMNMRPGEYLTRRRIQEARILLKDTLLPIAEIAKRSGFSDAGYFSTVFRKLEGVPPAEFRRRQGIQ